MLWYLRVDSPGLPSWDPEGFGVLLPKSCKSSLLKFSFLHLAEVVLIFSAAVHCSSLVS